MGADHPECPERLDAIEDRLKASGLADFLVRGSAEPAGDNLLLMAHSASYLAWLKNEHQMLMQEYSAGGPGYEYVDPDTRINRYTLQAIRRSAGLCVAATEAVFSGELDNAFCAVRPPGHHAERARAHGFCFVNNASIAAMFALESLGLQRVAVVDLDVHHGNGTEDILAGDARVIMVSYFQHPFFPHMGVPPKAENMFNFPVEHYTKGDAIRELVIEKWLPVLIDFKPQMIFISAGFDAHREDDMGQLGLVENDFAWITSELMQVAKLDAGGRIVSCLEGGYDLSALGRCAEAHIRTLAGLD